MNQTAAIETEKAERLMKALTNHFARKTTAQYEGNKGYIEFKYGKCEITSTPTLLTLQANAESEDDLEHVKRVVAEHLLRFVPGEDIQINWKNPA